MRAQRSVLMLLVLTLCLVCIGPATAAPPSPADVNGDGVVNILDLVAICLRYGTRVQSDVLEDVNRNGTVDLLDLVLVSRALAPSEATSLPEVNAWVSNVTPRQYSDVIVYGKLTRDGVGIPGVPMRTTWHYRTTASYCDAVSGGSGVASCTRFIRTATVGYYVSITVEFSYQGHRFLAETGFTPQGSAVTSVTTQPIRATPVPTPRRSTGDTGCCKHCGPNSKPCGNSCISLKYTCHKGAGCACW